MKRVLYLKMLTGYIIFAIASFLFLFFYVNPSIQRKVTEEEAKTMYTAVNEIASNSALNYVSGTLSLDSLNSYLKEVSVYFDSDIWVVNTKNKVTTSATTSGQITPEYIIDFDPFDFHQTYYRTGDFFNIYSSDVLTVYAPITKDFNIAGYLFIHEPIDHIIEKSDVIMNQIYEVAAIIFLLSFIVLMVFTIFFYRPLMKITRAGVEYSIGNFKPEIDVHTNDELGYLASTLELMTSKLDTYEDDQRKFISNVSHDFRSPLTSIKGYLEAILDGTIPPELYDKYLKIVLNEANRLAKLTQDMLDLNRIGSIGASLELSDFDINHVIHNVADSSEVQCNKKHLELSLILYGDSLMVHADKSKIEQVIYNLIDNAIKFSKPDTTITIETTLKKEKLFVSVKDQGIGIPNEDLTNVFTRFYKTDTSRGKDKKGTGLGLAIVKEILQAHGQNIDAVSTKGAGANFIFTLSLAKEELERLV